METRSSSYVDLESETNLRRTIPQQLEKNYRFPKAWNKFFYTEFNDLGAVPTNQYEAVINLFKDYCSYNENEENDESYSAKLKNTFTLHKNNSVVSDTLRSVLSDYSIEKCLATSQDDRNPAPVIEARTQSYIASFFTTLESYLRQENKFLNPAGSLVKRILFAESVLLNKQNKQYIDLQQLCFDLSEEKTRERKAEQQAYNDLFSYNTIHNGVEEKTTEKAAVEEKTVEVVESAEDLSNRLRPVIAAQLEKLPKPEKWKKFFVITGCSYEGDKKYPYETNVNSYEAVINLFQDYCGNQDNSWTATASNFFTSHQHNELISGVLAQTLASFSIENCLYNPEMTKKALNCFFKNLAFHLRNNNQYLNPTGSLAKRINFAAAYGALDGTDNYLPQLCIDLSNEMINLRKSQEGVEKVRDTRETHEDENRLEEESSSSFSM